MSRSNLTNALKIAQGRDSRPWSSLQDVLRATISACYACALEIIHQRSLRRLERELERVDDRTLKDIGLERSQIKRAVHLGRDFWSDAAPRTGR